MFMLANQAMPAEGDCKMPGTRTAPPVDGTGSFARLSIGMIDAQGDIRSVSLIVDAALSAANQEALVDALQTITNASIYEIEFTQVYSGARSVSNASDEVVNSVYSNIVYHVKSSPTSSQRGYVPAPIDAVFVADTDTPDTTNADLAAWFAAVLTAVGVAYTGQSVRYTERREINDAVKF